MATASEQAVAHLVKEALLSGQLELQPSGHSSVGRVQRTAVPITLSEEVLRVRAEVSHICGAEVDQS